jgi:hypothetical protein
MTYKFDFDKIFDPELTADGEIVQMRVLNARIHTSEQSGRESIRLVLLNTVNPKAEAVIEYIGLPSEAEMEALASQDPLLAEEAQQANKKLTTLRDLYNCFGVPTGTELEPSGQDRQLDVFTRREGYCVIGIEPAREGYPPRNRVRNFK